MTKPKLINPVSNTSFQLIVSVVLSSMIITINNIRSLFAKFDEGSDVPRDTMFHSIGNHISDGLAKLNEIPNAATIATASVFVVVAILLYVGYILLSDVFITVGNDLKMQEEVYDNRVKRYLVWHNISKLLVALMYVGFLVLTLKLLLPYWLDITSNYFLSNFNSIELADLIKGFGGMSLNLYLLLVLGRISFQHAKSL